MADLITLADVKTYSGISSTNSDTEIAYLIPKISELAKNYCGRTFIDYFEDPKVEYFSGGTDKLLPVELPIVNITSFEQSIDYGKTYSVLENYVDYAYNKDTETLDSITTSTFPRLLNGYRLTYTAGYEFVPEDLKLALMDLVSYYMRADMAVKSTRSPGANTTQIEYVMNATLPSHIRRVLDGYRLVL